MTDEEIIELLIDADLMLDSKDENYQKSKLHQKIEVAIEKLKNKNK